MRGAAPAHSPAASHAHLTRRPAPQTNGKTSFAPAQFASFEEILEHLEAPRQELAWAEEEAEML